MPELRHIPEMLLRIHDQLQKFGRIVEARYPVKLNKPRIAVARFPQIWRQCVREMGQGLACQSRRATAKIKTATEDLVRAAGLEPALLAKADFESAASTIPPQGQKYTDDLLP